MRSKHLSRSQTGLPSLKKPSGKSNQASEIPQGISAKVLSFVQACVDLVSVLRHSCPFGEAILQPRPIIIPQDRACQEPLVLWMRWQLQ